MPPTPPPSQPIGASPRQDWSHGGNSIERGWRRCGRWARIFLLTTRHCPRSCSKPVRDRRGAPPVTDRLRAGLVLITSLRAIGWLGLWLCVFGALRLIPLWAQEDEPITLTAYQEKVASWQATLAEADDEQVAAVQKEAAAIRQVTLPSGKVITIQPLLGDPVAETIDIRVAQERLATVQRELAAAPHDETAARLLLLQNIWRRQEFAEQDSLWQRFWRWVRSWLPEFESREGGATPISPLFQVVGWGLLGVGAVLLIFLLSYWLQTLLGRFMGGVERRGERDENAPPQTADEARTAAHRLANAGSYRDAVRQLYLSALLSLHERNLITYQPSDTNREVLTAVRQQPQLHQQLQPVVATFDDVWYGVHEPDRTTFDRYVVAVEQLEGKPS